MTAKEKPVAITREGVAKLLGRDAILAAVDLPTKDVDVPEWGGMVRLRAMNAVDRDDFELKIFEARSDGRSLPENVRAIIAARCIVGEDGEQLFTIEDVQALGLKSAAALGRVYDAVLQMNSIQPGAIEDAAKN